MAEYIFTTLNLYDLALGKEEEPKQAAEDHQDYADRYRQIKLFFMSTIDEQWYTILTVNKEPHKIWKALEQKFGLKNLRTFFFQYRSLMHLKLEDTSRLSEHLTHFETEWNRFQHRCQQGKAEDKLKLPYQLQAFASSEQAKATTLLASLPDEMDNIVDNLLTKDLTYDETLSRLMDLGQKGEKNDKEDSAYQTTNRTSKKQKSKQSQEKRTKDSGKESGCTYCRKRYPNTNYSGHSWNECRKLKADQEKKRAEKGGSSSSSKDKGSVQKVMSDSESNDERVRLTSISTPESPWALDTGASSHVTSKLDLFVKIKPASGYVRVADERRVPVEGVGEVHLDCQAPGGTTSLVRLKRVLYVPELGNTSLLSWKAVNKQEYKLVGEDEWLCIQDKRTGEIIIWAKETRTDYVIQQVEECARITYEEWHQAMCHTSPTTIHKDLYKDKNEVPLLPKNFHCKSCALSKSTKKVPEPLKSHAKEPLERCHSDLSGKFSVPSMGKSRYYITLIDEYTRYSWVRFLKRKSEAGAAMKSMVQQAERQTGRKLKSLRSDNGGEYIAMDPFLKDEGIDHEYSPAYSHESNGMAERFNRTIITMARSMLNSSGMNLSFWSEAIDTAVYTKNRLPHQAFENKKTPYEVLHAEKPSIKHLQPFGRECYVHIAKEQRPAGTKLLPRAYEGKFVGYKEATDKIYRIYIPSKRRIIETRQVTFAPLTDSRAKYDQDIIQPKEPSTSVDFEIQIPYRHSQQQQSTSENETQNDEEFQDAREHLQVEETPGVSTDNRQEESQTQPHIEPPPLPAPPGAYQRFSPTPTPQPEASSERRYPQRERRPPQEWWKSARLVIDECKGSVMGEAHVYAAAIQEEPLSFNQAIESDHAADWYAAMGEELKALEKNNTWEVVDRPARQSIVDCKWVYKVKQNFDGTTERYKARLVARGFTQRPGYDYDETFSPVVRYESLRLLLALSAHNGW